MARAASELMCSACGILQGGVDWTESIGAETAAPHERLAARRRRLQIVNLMLEGSGVRLYEHGRQLVLRSATGVNCLVMDLAHVWRAADAMGRRPVDPLAPELGS